YPCTLDVAKHLWKHVVLEHFRTGDRLCPNLARHTNDVFPSLRRELRVVLGYGIPVPLLSLDGEVMRKIKFAVDSLPCLIDVSHSTPSVSSFVGIPIVGQIKVTVGTGANADGIAGIGELVSHVFSSPAGDGIPRVE